MIILVLILVLLICNYYVVNTFDEGNLIFILLLSLVALIYYFKNDNNDKINKHLFRPSFLLMVGLTIIAYQNTIDLLLGNINEYDSMFITPSLINKVLSFASMALVSLIIGYSFTHKPFNCSKYKNSTRQNNVSINLLVWLSILLFGFFVLSIDSSFFNGEDYIEGGAINKSNTNTSEFFLNICFSAILIQHAINTVRLKISIREYIINLPKVFIIIFVSYLALRLISGSRAPVLRCILLFLFSYVYATRQQPFKNLILIVLIIIGGGLFSIISFSRGIITNNIMDKYADGMELFEQSNSISPITAELAHSQYCNHVAVNEFSEGQDDILFGAIQARYVASIFIPNRILQQIWPAPVSMHGSAYYLTAKVYGENSTSGMGTTLNADFYIDFGIIGMIFCMMLIGVLYKKMDLTLYLPSYYSPSLLTIVLIVSLGSISLYLSRAPFIPLLRTPLFTFILLAVNRLIIFQSK